MDPSQYRVPTSLREDDEENELPLTILLHPTNFVLGALISGHDSYCMLPPKSTSECADGEGHSSFGHGIRYPKYPEVIRINVTVGTDIPYCIQCAYV